MKEKDPPTSTQQSLQLMAQPAAEAIYLPISSFSTYEEGTEFFVLFFSFLFALSLSAIYVEHCK